MLWEPFEQPPIQQNIFITNAQPTIEITSVCA
jgi:hypothetical protein